MRAFMRFPILAVLSLTVAVACSDDSPDGTGSIAITATPADPVTSTAAATPSGVSLSATATMNQDSAKVTVSGPTNQTATLHKGASGFTDTLTGLAVGSYT